MARFVALLRGINVGGKHKLAMAELRDRFAEAGADDVRTYIQSGNVVFAAPTSRGRRIGTEVSHALEAQHGWPAPIVVRPAAAWTSLLEGNPFAREASDDPKRVHALLFDRVPTAASRRTFSPTCTQDERWHLEKDALYIDFPRGSARTKLTVAFIDKALGCVATGRNWRTVLALDTMLNP